MPGPGERVGRRRRLAPARALWSIGGLFGLAFLAVTPPGDPPDEKVHYARAFLVSEGHLGMVGRRPGHGARVPRRIVELHPEPEGHHDPELLQRLGMKARPRALPHSAEEILGNLDRPLAPRQRQRVFYVSAYSPVPYLHQAAAVWVGRKLQPSVTGSLYLARLANLALFLGAVAAAVRLSPIRRWTLVLLALSPAALFQAASVSADPPTVAIAFVVVGLAWRAAYGVEHMLTKSLRWAFVASCLLLGLAKPGYWPLAGLALGVPGGRFASGRSRVWWILLAAGAVTLPSFAWLLYGLWVDPMPLAAGADANAQLRGILRDPLHFAQLLVHTLLGTWRYYAMGCVGWLGHHEVLLPTWVHVAVPLAATGAALLDRGDPEFLGHRARALHAALFGLGCASMMTMAYLGWNAVDAPLIRGVQGRYFIPLLPLLAALLPSRGWPLRRRLDGLYAALAAAALASALIAVIRQYYTV